MRGFCSDTASQAGLVANNKQNNLTRGHLQARPSTARRTSLSSLLADVDADGDEYKVTPEVLQDSE